MVRTKEDRSGWVAVQPEFSSAGGSAGSDGRPPIKPAKSAYQFFQKEHGSSIHRELSLSGAPCDVGALGREVSSRWQALPPLDRHAYEEMAKRDRARFASESRERDAEALERKGRLQRERETLILDDDFGGGGGGGGGGGRRATRQTRMKGQRKAERKKAKREEKKEGKKRKAAAARKGKKATRVGKTKKDDDSDYDDEKDDDNSDASDAESSGDRDGSSSSYDDDDEEESSSSPSSSSSDDDDSDDSDARKPAPKRPPPRVSQAVLDRRERAREEKLRKERYIELRQSDVRGERADQAKRRLEFLLKQSDIFGHFGNVKQERARLGLSSSGGVAAAAASSQLRGGRDSGRKAAVVRGAEGGETEEAERMEVDEHEATFLTSQPSTLRGQMRQYQLEGLNVSICRACRARWLSNDRHLFLTLYMLGSHL
jgi:hypothetical protein